MVERVTLRPKRQLTLPREVCDALRIKPGDGLVLEVSQGKLIARPQRQAARDALDELRRGFAESGVSLKELLKSGRKVREELFREKYGHLANEGKAAMGAMRQRSRRRRA